MGETIAFVQRGHDSRYYVSLIGNPNARGLPAFPSAGAAQKFASDSIGRTLQWTQIVEPPEGERWQGADPAWWPADLGENVVLWQRSDRGLRYADVASGTLPDVGVVWNSVAAGGESYQLSAAGSGAPASVVVGAANQLPAVHMYADQQYLLSNFDTLELPFTVAVACHYEIDVVAPARAVLSSSTFRFRIRTADAKWVCLSNTTEIVDSVATSGIDVVSAVVTALGTSFYVNGVLIGTTVDVPVGAVGALSLGSAAEPWSGDIYQVVVVDRALDEQTHLRRLIPYMQRNRR